MVQKKMFDTEFYKTENGQILIKEFIDSLPPKMGAKVTRDILILANRGNTLREPYSKYLKNGIFELRIQTGGDITRILYFFFIGQKIILTNGFIKKTQKTPLVEIEKAIKCKLDYERRYNDET